MTGPVAEACQDDRRVGSSGVRMKCGKREEIRAVIADRACSFKLLGLGFSAERLSSDRWRDANICGSGAGLCGALPGYLGRAHGPHCELQLE